MLINLVFYILIPPITPTLPATGEITLNVYPALRADPVVIRILHRQVKLEQLPCPDNVFFF